MSVSSERGSSSRGSLIIVCCHAIYLPDADASNPQQVSDEANWLLAEFQHSAPGKEGEHLTFIKHIQLAHDIAQRQASSSNNTRVIFSGGATKAETTKSEAQSYLDVWDTLSLSEATSTTAMLGASIEDRATDTFQNILFSLLRYRSLEAAWPAHITVVTHAFKAERIARHLRALKWPPGRFTVEGIDPPFGEAERGAVERSEQRCLDEWEADVYGVRAPLSEKRVQRLWRPDGAVYSEMTDDAAVRRLLEWDGGADAAALVPFGLPWEET